MSDANLIRTPLYRLHAALGAKFVPFAGYAMPVQYAQGIMHEHAVTRTRAGLFDVSHMGQISLRGSPAALEALVPSNIADLAIGAQRYTVLTNSEGGILDDLMVTRFNDHLHLVVNAAFKETDFNHLQRELGLECTLEWLADRALLALQGPAAAAVLAPLCPAAAALHFMQGCAATIADIPCLINRAGYTGEDGFEISIPARHAEHLAQTLLAHAAVEPVGLGARDSLRLEAGLCLSGADIDATTSPVAAGLSWTIAKKYVGDNAQPAHFPGAELILEQHRTGSARIRVGLRVLGRAIARSGANLSAAGGIAVGRITSGGFGPTVESAIAMGYVERAWSKPGTALHVTIRDREHAVEVVALPFVPHRYHKS